MRVWLTAAHEVDVGHVPLTPAAPPDAVHVRPRAQLILVVFASLVVAMYRRHCPTPPRSSFFRAHESPGTVSRRGFRVEMIKLGIGGFQMRLCCGRSGFPGNLTLLS